MKKYILILGLLLIHSYICLAQTNGSNQNDKVERVKVAFFTHELDLTATESKQFWPVYHKYFSEVRKIWQQSNGDRSTFEEKASVVKDNYRSSFVQILHSHERANKVFGAEKAYRAMLRQELNNRQKK